MAVQYNESSLDFISRLLEEEGIFFYHDQDGALVFADDTASFGPVSAGLLVPNPVPPEIGDEFLATIAAGRAFTANRATVKGYDFELPAVQILETARDGDGSREHFSWDAAIHDLAAAGARAAIGLEAVVGFCVSDDMNIPNSLTILRILLLPCYIGLLIYGRFKEALIVLLVAGITDALDGAIARMKNQHTRFGAVLDPLADKLLLTSGFITLSLIHLIPLWVTILVVSRDVILLLGTAVAHFTESRIDITPTFLGKGTTFLQLSYVVVVIFLTSRHIDLSIMLPLLLGMVSFTLLSGLHYLYRGFRHTSVTGG